MKRITPGRIFNNLPCSVVSVGCAIGASAWCDLNGLFSDGLRLNGFLSFKDMNTLIRANMGVLRRARYKRGERPALRDWAHENKGKRAILCVARHYVYFDGRDYHSFFWNGGDPVVEIWYLE